MSPVNARTQRLNNVMEVRDVLRPLVNTRAPDVEIRQRLMLRGLVTLAQVLAEEIAANERGADDA